MRVLSILSILCALIFFGTTPKVEAASTGCLPGTLKSRLNQVRSKFGPVTVISTYRKNARIRGTGRRSKHASCKAVDFKVRNKWGAYKWLTRNHNGGVGIYSGKCSHIHIDVGGRARWHHKRC